MDKVLYPLGPGFCKIEYYGENFIFPNNVKRHIWYVKNSQQGHDLPI